MKDTVVTITSGTIFKVVLIGLLLWLLYFLHDLVLVLLTAVVIASSVEPLTVWLSQFRIPRVIAVISLYLSFAILFAGMFYFFLPLFLEDLSGFLTVLPEYLETVSGDGGLTDGVLKADGLFGGLREAVVLKDAIQEVRNTLVNTSAGIVQSVSTIFGGLFSFMLIIVISFYLAVQEKGIQKFLEIIVPIQHEKYVINLWERSQKKIGLWMQGQLLLGFIVGVLVYLGLTVLQVKYALFLAVLAMFFEIIPLFGPILAAAPAVVFGFLDSFSTGAMVLGLFVIIQQFENHLIYPLVVRKVVGVSPIVVIIGLIVGAKLAGFLGILLSVPVAAALMEFFDDIQKEKYAHAQQKS